MDLTKIIGTCALTALFGCSNGVCIPMAKTSRGRSELKASFQENQHIYQVQEGDFLLKIAKNNSV
ncbi:hypothetical protein HY837_05475, partial [archaeon]|nr:hypothetical protein [archaeon]